MSRFEQENPWVWVVVQDPGANEQFLGQYDAKTDVAFIPLFREKEDALRCINLLDREKGKTCEPQAIVFSDLARTATANGFLLFLLDADGQIVEKIRP